MDLHWDATKNLKDIGGENSIPFQWLSFFNSGGAPKTGSGRRVIHFLESASINVEKDFGILSAARRASGSWLIVGRSPWIEVDKGRRQ